MEKQETSYEYVHAFLGTSKEFELLGAMGQQGYKVHSIFFYEDGTANVLFEKIITHKEPIDPVKSALADIYQRYMNNLLMRLSNIDTTNQKNADTDISIIISGLANFLRSYLTYHSNTETFASADAKRLERLIAIELALKK